MATTSLNASLSKVAKEGAPPEYKDGDVVMLDVDLLDDNPFQPRVNVDKTELEDLAKDIEALGQLQAIGVRPVTGGRFIIVLGHRRTLAFRLLRERSAEHKAKYQHIKAEIRFALDDAKMATFAYSENVKRAQLSPVEEGRALDRMVDAGVATTNEELATLTTQPLVRVQRLRKLMRGPKFVRDAVDAGVLVVIGKNDDGAETREKRSLDLMSALAFIKLYEHLTKEKPKKADERLEGAVRRALAAKWSLRRIEEYVKDVVAGRKGDEDSSDPEADTAAAATVFERSARKFTVDLKKLSEASEAQRAALRIAFEALLAPAEGGHHQ